MSLPETPPGRRGCLFYGVLSALGVVLVLGLGGYLFYRKAVRLFNDAMLTYTDTAPGTLPKIEMPAAELASLQKRVEAFGQGLASGSSTGPLILTDREVNALLQHTPQAQELHLEDHFVLTFGSNDVHAQVSLPMSNYNARIPGFHTAGRYFNGVVTLGVSFTNSELGVKVETVEGRGKTLPSTFIGVLQDWSDRYLLQDINNNPTNSEVLTNIATAIITNGSVVITPRN